MKKLFILIAIGYQLLAVNFSAQAQINGSSPVICSGGSATLTASGGILYLWSTGSTSPSITVSPTTTTTYTVTILKEGSFVFVTKAITVTVYPTPTVSISPPTAAVCTGNSTTLKASGANTYLWSNGATNNAISVAPTINTTYSVTGTNTYGCSATASSKVTVNPLPGITIDGNNIICSGSSTTLTASGAGIGGSYLWNTGQTTASITVSPTATTSYTVTGINSNGCSNTATVTITVNTTLPTITVTPPFVNLCKSIGLFSVGNTATFTASGAATYLWSTGATTSAITVSPISSTMYNVIGTSADGCSNTAVAVVTVGTTPTVAITPKSSTICRDDTVTLTANGAFYYLWSTGATTTTIQVAPKTTTTYSVAGATTFGCVDTASIEVLVNPLPVITVTPPFANIKIGGIVPLLASGSALTYNWSPPVGLNTLLGAAVTASPLISTIYTVTGTDINGCRSRAPVRVGVGEAQLYISIPQNDYGFSKCGEPSYLPVPILLSGDSSRFNSCVIDVNIGNIGSQFKGDNPSNGGVFITRGGNFQSGSGNDYDSLSVTNLNDSTIEIQFGYPTGSSPQGTWVYPRSYDTLLYVNLVLQDCETTPVTLGNAGNTAYYTFNNRTLHTMPDSVQDTICKKCVDCVPCGTPYCCSPGDTDEYGNCINPCYPDLCCQDSIHMRHFIDSTYTDSIENVAYNPITYYGSIKSYGCGLFIDPITTPVNAGTNAKSIPPNSSVLTITGSGFGAKQGGYSFIQVTNADNGGYSNIILDTSDVVHWSNYKIVVKMPSVIINTATKQPATPGTGPIEITNSCGDNNYSDIQINYNIENLLYQYSPGLKVRPNIIRSNDSASFIFRCDTSISRNKQAFACVKKAVRTWDCYTGVNWKVSNDTNIVLDTTVADGISDIYFANNNNFSNNSILMATTPEVFGCYNPTDSVAFYDEADIKIKRNQYLPSKLHWNYDTTYTSASIKYFYFYDVILHELGHAIGLGHVMDQKSLMYWQSVSGRRDSIPGGTPPGPQTLYGAFDMINTSIANPPSYYGCGSDNILQTDQKECKDATLSISPIITNSYSLNLYPNPASDGDITISYQLSSDSYVQFIITDCIGRAVITLPEKHETGGIHSERININNLAQGVYLFIANINGEIQNIKFIKI